MSYKAVILISLFALFLDGCATGEKFVQPITIPSGKASVYVYRERRLLGSGGAPDIFINGEKVARLPSGGYFIYCAAPGEIVFSNQLAIGPLGILWALVDRIAEAKKHAVLQFTVEAGKNYFVEWMLGYKIEQRDYNRAKDKLADCALVEKAASSRTQE